MTISFTEDTIVEHVKEEDHLIPMNKFEFATLDDHSNLASTTSSGESGNQKNMQPEFAYGIYIFYSFIIYVIIHFFFC